MWCYCENSLKFLCANKHYVRRNNEKTDTIETWRIVLLFTEVIKKIACIVLAEWYGGDAICS